MMFILLRFIPGAVFLVAVEYFQEESSCVLSRFALLFEGKGKKNMSGRIGGGSRFHRQHRAKRHN